MPNCGTVDAIYVLRQLSKNFRAKGQTLHWIFVDLEKAVDRIPRSIIVEALRQQNVPETLVQAVIATYRNCRSAVVVDGHLSETFGGSVGVHQGSILSPLLFITVIECVEYVTKHTRRQDLMEMLYVDDLALGHTSVEGVMERYTKWKLLWNGKVSK